MRVDQAGNVHDGGIAGIRRAKGGGFRGRHLAGNASTRNGHRIVSVRDVTHGDWPDRKSVFRRRSRPGPAPDYPLAKAGRRIILDLDTRVWHGFAVSDRGDWDQAEAGPDYQLTEGKCVGYDKASL
jgi:hypothetical protein